MKTQSEKDIEEKKKVDEIKPKITDDFLSTLSELARIYGWTGDYGEIVNFVEDCFILAEKEKPNLEFYEF